MGRKEFETEFDGVMKKMKQNFVNQPWGDKDFYSKWLRQSLEYAASSTRILGLTAGMLPPHLTALSNRFIAHAAEEKGHEKLLENDIKKMGQSVAGILLLPEAEAFHKSLYYWIFKGEPEVILGWVFALEGLAVTCGPKVYEICSKAHGKGSATFLKVHSQEDEDHLEKAFDVIDELSENETLKVLHGMHLYSSLYLNMMDAIAANSLGTNLQPKLAA